MKRLKERIKQVMSNHSIEIDQELHNDLSQIMEEHNHAVVTDFPDGSFQQLFWNQQLQAVRTDKRQLRWHPLINQMMPSLEDAFFSSVPCLENFRLSDSSI